MADTVLADIIEPLEYTMYMAEQSAKKSAIFQSGIAVRTSEYDGFANGKGTKIEIPLFLPLAGDEEVIIEGTDLTENNIDGDAQTGAKVYRGKAFGSSDLAVDFSGEDIIGEITRALMPYRIEKLQQQLVAQLTGALGTGGPLNATHVNTVGLATKTATSVFTAGGLTDTRTLIGDSARDIGLLICHSKVYADIQKAQLIDYVQPAGVDFEIPTVQGLTLFVDDDCPVDLNGANDALYTSYVCSAQSVIYGEGTPKVPLENYRNERGSTEGIIYRRQSLMHVNGLDWTGTPSAVTATDAELATGTNWAKVFSDDRNIKVLAFVTNSNSAD